jgi:hypothetical protein
MVVGLGLRGDWRLGRFCTFLFTAKARIKAWSRELLSNKATSKQKITNKT